MASIFSLIKSKMLTNTLSYKNVHSDQFCYELKYGTADSAGLDLYLTNVDNSNIVTSNGAVIGRMYGTNIAMEIPRGYVGQLYLRSSGAKAGLSMLNHVGIIDSDYRGEIKAMLYYPDIVHSPLRMPTEKPVLQIVIVPAPQFTVMRTDSLTMTARGNGGFGSTNVATLHSETISIAPSSETAFLPAAFAASVASTAGKSIPTVSPYTLNSSMSLSAANCPDPELEADTTPATTPATSGQTSLSESIAPPIEVDPATIPSLSMNRFNKFAEELNMPFPKQDKSVNRVDRVTQLKEYYAKRSGDNRKAYADNLADLIDNPQFVDPVTGKAINKGDDEIVEDLSYDPMYKPAF